MEKSKTAHIQIEMPIDVHNLYKMAKMKSDDPRSLKQIYIDILSEQSKKIKK